MELKDTVELMQSSDYKERFIAEYWQTKIRYEKLKHFNNIIEASRATINNDSMVTDVMVVEPKHDCPKYMLEEQQHLMGEYLHILEVRAIIEGIDLDVKQKAE